MPCDVNVKGKWTGRGVTGFPLVSVVIRDQKASFNKKKKKTTVHGYDNNVLWLYCGPLLLYSTVRVLVAFSMLLGELTLGPREERSVRATDLAAWMFAF